MSVPAFAAPGDRIKIFGVVLVLDKKAGLYVDEKLTVDFSEGRHGIVRNIPCSSVIDGSSHTCQIRLAGATCDGDAVASNSKFDGDRLIVKIGDPQRTLTGQHVYEIKYSVDGAVLPAANNNPRIYWNVTGNEWKMPIDEVRGILLLPADISPKSVKATIFTGVLGSSAQQGKITSEDKKIRFSAGPFSPGEGLTLAAEVPAGSVQMPGDFDKWCWQIPLIFGGLFAWFQGYWWIVLFGAIIFLAAWISDKSSANNRFNNRGSDNRRRFFGQTYANDYDYDSSNSSSWSSSSDSDSGGGYSGSSDSGSSGGGCGGGGGDSW